MWHRRRLEYALHRYALRSFLRESPPRVEELARAMRVPERTLVRLTNRLLGCSPGAYLRAVRRAYAARLMRRTTLSTTRIAYRSGYGTRRSIYRSFRRETGHSPREYQSRRRRTASGG